MCRTRVRRLKESCCEIYIMLNYLGVWLQILATATYCTSDLHYLALKPRYDAQVLWPLRCFSLAMNMSSHANAMPDLWRTSLVKDGISLAKHATLSWNLQPRLPATDTQEQPSWVKIRSSTGPWETRVPAAPVQLLLLRVPVSAASWTATRKVEDLQSSSRTALSVVQALTEMISWPRQSSPSIQHGTAQKHNSKGCSYIWFFTSFHTLNRCEVAGLSCESWCITVLVIGAFSAAAAGPAELFRISISPPLCVRFFATSALESRSYNYKRPLQVADSEEWQVQHQKICQGAAPCPVVAILSRFMLRGAWRHRPCLRCLPGPLFQYETQPPSWTAIFGGVENWIRMKEATYLPVPLQPKELLENS